jgi:hypothetical protein
LEQEHQQVVVDLLQALQDLPQQLAAVVLVVQVVQVAVEAVYLEEVTPIKAEEVVLRVKEIMVALLLPHLMRFLHQVAEVLAQSVALVAWAVVI